MFSACHPLIKFRRTDRQRAAFSLLELLAALGMMATLVTLVAPALLPVQNAGRMTQAAYDVAEVLENRTGELRLVEESTAAGSRAPADELPRSRDFR